MSEQQNWDLSQSQLSQHFHNQYTNIMKKDPFGSFFFMRFNRLSHQTYIIYHLTRDLLLNRLKTSLKPIQIEFQNVLLFIKNKSIKQWLIILK